MGRYALPVIAVALFIAFLRLGSFTLFDVDEAVFAQASKEMLASGNLVTPTYNGQDRFDKPILIYWLMAASYKAFGVNAFAARFPSAAAAVLLALSIFFFTGLAARDASPWGEAESWQKKAFNAAVCLVLTVFFLVYSHAAVTDMTLTLFITLSLFCFYLAAAKGRGGFIYGFYFFSALAFLTKGLIGVVFPFGIAFLYRLLFLRRVPKTAGRESVGRVWSASGFLLFLAVGLPWYVAEYLATGDEFIRNFFIKQHFVRYMHVISGHTGPFYYYVPVLALGLFPWIAYLPQGVAGAFRQKGSSPGLLAVIWLSFVLVFFSFARTKLPDYVLPAVPAAALLMGSGMSRACYTRYGMSGTGRLSNWFIAFAALLMGAGLFLAKGYLLRAGIRADWPYWIAGIMLLMAAFSAYAALSGKSQNLVLALLMICLLSVAVLKAVPAASEYLQGSLYRYSLYARENLRPDGVLIGYKINNPSVVFYSGRRVVGAEDERELRAALSGGSEAMIITKTGDAKEVDALIGPSLKLKLLESGGNYSLFEKK
ncbi:MAG: glycosyltransferase family 39 protein [Nitrospiraceae bacterium]|nr:glycosyltransferase family 39 protein [Nitrospiraceae bacterium]